MGTTAQATLAGPRDASRLASGGPPPRQPSRFGRATARFFAWSIPKRILVVGLSLLIGLSILIWLTENILFEDKWIFWVQTVSGNWSGAKAGHSQFAFSISSWLALLLNQASILGIVWLLLALFEKRRKERIMRLSSIYRSRDIAIINSIVSHLPAERQKSAREDLERQFDEGHDIWKTKHLSAIFPEDAEQMRKLLEVGEIDTATSRITVPSPAPNP